MTPRTWHYATETIAGNFHTAVGWLNTHHPEWDVVAMSFTGNYTIIVYRIARIDGGGNDYA